MKVLEDFFNKIPSIITEKLISIEGIITALIIAFALFIVFNVLSKHNATKLSVFFLLYMVCRYHPWSSEPEPQSCFFHIMALSGLTVTAYLRGNLMLSRKSWKGYTQVSRWAIFAAIAAIPGCVDAAPLALWAVALLLDGCKARKSL